MVALGVQEPIHEASASWVAVDEHRASCDEGVDGARRDADRDAARGAVETVAVAVGAAAADDEAEAAAVLAARADAPP